MPYFFIPSRNAVLQEDFWKAEKSELKTKLLGLFRSKIFTKYATKFVKKFHLHFDGEFKIKSKKGVEKLEGTGGHNHSVIGKNIRVRKYLTQPIDDLPFDALIEVRYKNGDWIEKTQEIMQIWIVLWTLKLFSWDNNAKSRIANPRHRGKGYDKIELKTTMTEFENLQNNDIMNLNELEVIYYK